MGIDYVTLTGPEDLREVYVGIIEQHVHESASRGGQLQFYRQSLRWACGLVMGCEQVNGHTVMVQLGGDVLASMLPAEVYSLLHALCLHGMKPTRLDVAVDHRNPQGVGLIEEIKAACRREEHCGPRSWAPCEKFGAGNGYTSNGVVMGKRGKDGSGRYIRVYDKGLETGTEERGQWERWEVEFSGDCALQALRMLLNAGQDGWSDTAVSLAYGAVEFREALCDSSGELIRKSRRPLAQWWEQWVGGLKLVCVRARRVYSTLEGTAAWIRTAVAPVLVGMAEATGQSMAEVLQDLTGGDFRPRVAQHCRSVWQYLQSRREVGRAGFPVVG